jgi:hypothetical protein
MKSWLCFFCFFFFCGFYYKLSFDHLHEYNNNVCLCCSFTLCWSDCGKTGYRATDKSPFETS